MALLEAQAAGLPVAAGRTGGVPDVVRDGRTGALCPVGDPVAFADTVAGLVSEPARLDAMRDKALVVTAAENDIATAAHRLDSILRTTTKARTA
jgi:glycosyltransferase involved in cell wall biosynthesis